MAVPKTLAAARKKGHVSVAALRMRQKGTVGALHREMGVAAGQKIPTARLQSIKSRLSAKAKGEAKLSATELRTLRRVNWALARR